MHLKREAGTAGEVLLGRRWGSGGSIMSLQGGDDAARHTLPSTGTIVSSSSCGRGELMAFFFTAATLASTVLLPMALVGAAATLASTLC
eukprot:scaffold177475_cov22-Tisochrysis_lutea.AAC.2